MLTPTTNWAMAQETSESIPGIGGVAYHEMAWVRVTDADHIVSGPDGMVEFWGHGQATGLALIEYGLTRGDDVFTISPNFRNTVHGALNHHVVDHAYGSWKDKNTVVVGRLDAMVALNGPPAGLVTVDTYWTLAPGGVLKVPEPTLVTPDVDALLLPAETHRRISPSSICYATSFNAAREAALMVRMTASGREALRTLALRRPRVSWECWNWHTSSVHLMCRGSSMPNSPTLPNPWLPM